MKEIVFAAAACLSFGIAAMPTIAQEESSPQQEPSGMETSRTINAKATVQDIDYNNRTVTLKGEDGKVFTVKVGEEARNFNRIKKGDQVNFHYKESLALAVRKSDEPPSASEQQTIMRAEPGLQPAGAATRARQITATVENINRDKREVTLRGPEGNTRTLKVGKDVPAFDRLQTGDQVVATYVETFAVEVTKPSQ